ncbi:zinc metalloproteinase nas-1 isoform X2 [Drosophila miranda]|uniref:zinc metalloproteinase nas-1 isoform X2 n=1 Tax=Drosophila miranda TaxID=7229 RepID=UPI0007E7CF2B|nr:zinc metalloproteinase nas-1 isoform X2 [Drosophila miranda]
MQMNTAKKVPAIKRCRLIASGSAAKSPPTIFGGLGVAGALPMVDLDSEDVIDLSDLGEAIFGNPDSETTGVLVDAHDEQSQQNPEELGTYYEGDILIPLSYREARSNSTRNGILAQSFRWPGAVVPYEIKGPFTTQELGNINHAFKEYHTRTCVRFKPRSTEKDYISIGSGKSGCWSSIGRLGGRQEVNLQSPNCLRTYGTPIHELMHALGFFHEQNRHERDSYVKVMSDNIKPDMMANFEKASSRTQSGFGVDYDYGSVMHYSSTSFTRNGQPTLKALRPSSAASQMGQRKGFSDGDVRKINAMYKCKV